MKAAKPLIIGGAAMGLFSLIMGMKKKAFAAPFVVPNHAGVLEPSAGRDIRTETRAVVYHTTSRSLPRRLVADGADPDRATFIEAVVARYQYITTGRSDAAYGHVVITPDGSHEWLAHPDRVAFHSGSQNRGADVPDWWRRRWPGVGRPHDLINLGGREYINRVTVSVDVVPRPDAAQGEFTDAALETAARIGRGLAERYGLGLTREHHLGHSDLDPIARGNAAGGWDPGWGWPDFMARLKGGAGTRPSRRRRGTS